MPVKVVGIRFKKAGKVYYFDPGEIAMDKGNHVVVETTRGIEYGEVVVAPREVPDEEVVAPLKRVLRKATPEDHQQVEANREKEKKAFQVALEKIAAHDLPMKLISVEQTFDGNKIIFYFTADGRIDFRELVKDLAAVFRTRIELRQIGVRDEAKMVGGLGCCGRELCCASWLADFAPVSIRMAKEQNLSLNPTKISGICGRLMCCLKYENDVYEEAKAGYPEIGTPVLAPEGEGKIVAINIFRKTLSVELQESKAIREYPLQELKFKKGRGECNCGCPARQD
ncbi:MAG: stage 0 sporulation family protein [Firmicutes bacterium]|nr:stage 0 sporulation family protein [Bacillota bacterium]